MPHSKLTLGKPPCMQLYFWQVSSQLSRCWACTRRSPPATPRKAVPPPHLLMGYASRCLPLTLALMCMAFWFLRKASNLASSTSLQATSQGAQILPCGCHHLPVRSLLHRAPSQPSVHQVSRQRRGYISPLLLVHVWPQDDHGLIPTSGNTDKPPLKSAPAGEVLQQAPDVHKQGPALNCMPAPCYWEAHQEYSAGSSSPASSMTILSMDCTTCGTKITQTLHQPLS